MKTDPIWMVVGHYQNAMVGKKMEIDNKKTGSDTCEMETDTKKMDSDKQKAVSDICKTETDT